MLGFGTVYLMTKERIKSVFFFKLVVLNLVLTTALALIVMGYTQEQIAPMMGLLGTVAGYLLGKGEGEAAPSESG